MLADLLKLAPYLVLLAVAWRMGRDAKVWRDAATEWRISINMIEQTERSLIQQHRRAFTATTSLVKILDLYAEIEGDTLVINRAARTASTVSQFFADAGLPHSYEVYRLPERGQRKADDLAEPRTRPANMIQCVNWQVCVPAEDAPRAKDYMRNIANSERGRHLDLSPYREPQP